MALLRNIFYKDSLWRFNNKPHVEPNEEQQELTRQHRLEATKILMRMNQMTQLIRNNMGYESFNE